MKRVFQCMMAVFVSLSAAAQEKSQLMTEKSKAIAVVAAYTAIDNTPGLKAAVSDALAKDVSMAELKEVMTQMYAYSGFPNALNALHTLLAVAEERKNSGIQENWGTDEPMGIAGNMSEIGENVRTQLVGRPVTGAVYEFCPVIDEYLRSHLFGDIFARKILSHEQRELATVSALAAMGKEAQLQSHKAICLNLGYTETELDQWIDNIRHDISVLSFKDAFPKGNLLAGNPNFTGEAWQQPFVTVADSMDCTVANVTFAPGVRNSWHAHPGGQVLLCTSGKGYYQEKGKPIQLLLPGDVVNIAPNVIHWHGAAPDSEFTHIAIGTQTSKGGAVWYEPVSDEEYNSYINL